MATRQAHIYDRIGGQYRAGRQEDPRIAARIWAALKDESPVVNVGAGSGSYEPRDRPVVAAEPSAVMLSQRPASAAPAVRAVAEALPFDDGSFGAAMGVLTVHHWHDRARGLAEMRRVARGPVVLFVRDPHAVPSWWLDPQIWRPMSALALIPDTDRADGMHRLRADLASGEWDRRWGHLLALDELDLGYRVVVTRP